MAERGVKFIYEKKLKLRLKRFKKITIKPDFFLPDYGMYIEFWGPADDNFSYRQAKIKKEQLYQQNGIVYISLYPRDLKNLEHSLLEKLKKEVI